MAEITLTQGKTAIVDDADLPVVEKYTWHAAQYEGHWYATTNVLVGGKGTTVKMHRVILGLGPADPDVDHRDGNGLNNRRLNLRLATSSQNNANSIGQPRLRKSKYKGVHWAKSSRYTASGFWQARITLHGKTIRRSAQTELAAARLYNELAKEHFGEFARFNDHTEICLRCGRWLKT